MNSRGVGTTDAGLDLAADLDKGLPSRRLSARSSKAPAWPVSLRERYGSITLAEVLRFHLIRWHTHRNLRRCRNGKENRPRGRA